jgi:hypothetical protein
MMDRKAGADNVLFEEFLDGTYDCVDRIVLRAYFQLGRRVSGCGGGTGRDRTRG